MATRTFSGRVDADQLAFADSLSKKEYGLSFGQYCGTILLKNITDTGSMPILPKEIERSNKKREAISFIKSFSSQQHNSSIGNLPDLEIRDMIASRYE